MKRNFITGTIFLTVPVIASAEKLVYVKTLISSVAGIVSLATPVAFALALLFFFWGVAQFIMHAGDSAEHEKGRQLMIWGVVALFAISSVWGLVALLQDNFDVPGYGASDIVNNTQNWDTTGYGARSNAYDNTVQGNGGGMVNVNDWGYAADGTYYGPEYEGDESAAYQPDVDTPNTSASDTTDTDYDTTMYDPTTGTTYYDSDTSSTGNTTNSGSSSTDSAGSASFTDGPAQYTY